MRTTVMDIPCTQFTECLIRYLSSFAVDAQGNLAISYSHNRGRSNINHTTIDIAILILVPAIRYDEKE